MASLVTNFCEPVKMCLIVSLLCLCVSLFFTVKLKKYPFFVTCGFFQRSVVDPKQWQSKPRIQKNVSRYRKKNSNRRIIWSIFFQQEHRNQSKHWGSLYPLSFACDCTHSSFHCPAH